MADEEATDADALFESQMQEVKSAEWKVMRDQMRTLSKGLREVLRKADEQKSSAGEDLARLKDELKRGAEDRQREKELRQRAEERLQDLAKEVERLREDLAEDRREREEGDAGVPGAKLDVLGGALEARHQDHLALEESLNSLRAEVDSFQPALELMRDSMSRDARDRKAEEESIMEYVREHDKLLRDAQVRDTACRATLDSLRDAVEQDKADRSAATEQWRNDLGEMQAKFAPITEELRSLRGKLPEIEDIPPRLRDHQKALDKVTLDQANSNTRFENRITELGMKVEAESAARRAREEEMEQTLSASRAKMQGLLAKQAENSRLAHDTLIKDFQSHLGKETACREEHHDRLQERLAGQRAQLQERIDALQKGVSALERQRKEEATLQRSDNLALKKHDDLAKQIRDLREGFIGSLAKERDERMEAIVGLEDRVAFLNRIFQDIGRKFGGTQRSPSRASTPDRNFPRSNGMAEAERRGPPRASSAGPLIGGAAAPRSPVVAAAEPNLVPPELTEDKQRALLQVLSQNRVEFITDPPPRTPTAGDSPGERALAIAGRERGRLTLLESQVKALEEKVKGLNAAELRLKEPLTFKAVPSGGPPVAYFLHEDAALEVLGDVAEVLKVYNMAALRIEGHADVAPDKMDQWAQEVAMGRAEMVRSTLHSFGVELARLETRGLPESATNPGQCVTLKIASF